MQQPLDLLPEGRRQRAMVDRDAKFQALKDRMVDAEPFRAERERGV